MKSILYKITHMNEILTVLKSSTVLKKEMFDEINIFNAELVFNNLKVVYMVSLLKDEESIADFIFYYWNKEDEKYYEFYRNSYKLGSLRAGFFEFRSLSILEKISNNLSIINGLYNENLLSNQNNIDFFEINQTIEMIDAKQNIIYDNEVFLYNDFVHEKSMEYPIGSTHYIYFDKNQLTTVIQYENKFIIINKFIFKNIDNDIFYTIYDGVFDVLDLGNRETEMIQSLEKLLLQNITNIQTLNKHNYVQVDKDKIYLTSGGI